MDESVSDETSSAVQWQPIPTTERRVFGVLIEKAKTTRDAYPLTINSIVTGSNQKSNRSPLMNLEPIDAENALENLRRLGAVSEVHGSGRMAKYRHRVYEWLNVDKVEAAVMAELLLRGEQTIGELRGRAARMEPIADVSALRPVLKSLQEKGLIQVLTPEGRGQIVTHCLYMPEQQEKLKRNFADAGNISISTGSEKSESTGAVSSQPDSESQINTRPAAPVNDSDEVANLQAEIETLKEDFAELEKRIQTLEQFIN